MLKRLATAAMFFGMIAAPPNLSAADKGNIGTIFVRVASSGNGGQSFADPALDATLVCFFCLIQAAWKTVPPLAPRGGRNV